MISSTIFVDLSSDVRLDFSFSNTFLSESCRLWCVACISSVLKRCYQIWKLLRNKLSCWLLVLCWFTLVRQNVVYLTWLYPVAVSPSKGIHVLCTVALHVRCSDVTVGCSYSAVRRAFQWCQRRIAIRWRQHKAVWQWCSDTTKD